MKKELITAMFVCILFCATTVALTGCGHKAAPFYPKQKVS